MHVVINLYIHALIGAPSSKQEDFILEQAVVLYSKVSKNILYLWRVAQLVVVPFIPIALLKGTYEYIQWLK